MAKKEEESSYEEAVERLESIIEALEGGEIKLEDLVARFEEGSKLLKLCQKRLKEAEMKIETLNPESGELEPFTDGPDGPDA